MTTTLESRPVPASSSTTSAPGAAISVRGVEMRFPGKDSDVLALSGLDLHIEAGQFVSIVGASGCGKSTLLRLLAGFETATDGVIELGGVPVRGPGPDRGVVFQDYGLFPWRTSLENVAYGPRRNGLSRKEARAVAGDALALVGLETAAGRFPGQLSGGMQQRVAIARALANRPSVLLMDEPFGALDAMTRSSLQEELSRIHRETGTTTVFITHSVEEAVNLSDRVIVMAGGAGSGLCGHVIADIDIELPRPRDVNATEFNRYERAISGLIHGDGS
ncbi:ABC transporter ATP-binding protein [Dietzia kunjamensis]|uniref:ABC transporter ATP-binding protein n=1 Tax=Dietzia kunjamensis TaxID=322509 RepID=UPI002DB6822E|nr:ABC transporter ATP-binding protein [Dietzia kunjamensis]MEB8326840.1 ABC transporter ATP-binding protein [Dietzia kunjamensis]